MICRPAHAAATAAAIGDLGEILRKKECCRVVEIELDSDEEENLEYVMCAREVGRVVEPLSWRGRGGVEGWRGGGGCVRVVELSW